MCDAEFSFARKFDIDCGELNHLSVQQCFVLGYELAQIDSLIRSRCGFEKPVHVDNRDRIEAELKRHGKEYKFEWSGDDKSESWVYLSVREAS